MIVHKTINDILPLYRLQKWQKGWEKPVDWMDYLQVNIHPEDILIVGKFLFPAFIEIDDVVLLQLLFNEAVYRQTKDNFSTKRNIELSMNHIYILDVFSVDNRNDLNVYENIALMVKTSWEFSLGKCFPGRQFEVAYSNTESDYGPTLTFCEQ
jgi:hypothetical protein